MSELLFQAMAGTMGFNDAVSRLVALMMLCSTRPMVAMMVLPATGDQALQGLVRAGMTAMLGFFIAWGQPGDALGSVSGLMVVVLMVKEVLLGLVLGFAFSSVFWVAEGVGTLVDNAAGFNNVQQTNPLSGQSCTPVGNLFSNLVIAAFYMLGGMLVCIGLLLESFHWWPLQSVMPAPGPALEDFLRQQVSDWFSTTVKIAAPVMIVLVLIDVGFGIIAKTADKLEPSNLSQPVRALVATLMLSLLVALFFQQARTAISLHDLQQALAERVGELFRGP